MRVTFQNNRHCERQRSICREAIQPLGRNCKKLDCCVANAPRNDMSFTGNESRFFDWLVKPTERLNDRIGEWLAKNFTEKVFNNKTIDRIAGRYKDNDRFYTHIATVSSIITSGLYAYRTVSNNKLDKDRRNTLAINQLLTLGVSILGSYTIDKALSNKWKNLQIKYAGAQLNDPKFYEKFKAQKEHKLYSYIGETFEYKKAEEIASRLNGFELLKKMVILSMVYRYLVPVLVTPIANKLGDKHLEVKQKKSGN